MTWAAQAALRSQSRVAASRMYWLMAMAGRPRMAASRAAPTVPL